MSVSAKTRKHLDDIQRLIGGGGAAAAMQQITRLAKEEPVYEVLLVLGQCHLARGDAKQAIIPLAAATGLTDQPEPAALLAEALLDVGRKEDALLIAKRVLHRDPRNRKMLRIMQGGGSE